MTDAATPAPSPKRRHARIYVYRFQKTYALWLCLLLFIYSVVIFGLEFAAPYVLPALKLIAPLPLEERALAAQQFLAFGQTLWPALAVLIVAAAVFSLHLTHRLAGPLHRLHQSARELAQGNLTLRVRLRRGDELHELAHVANTALVNLDQAFGDIRAHGAHSQAAVGRVVEALRAQPGANPEYLADWEGALKESEQLEAVLQRFRFAERLHGQGAGWARVVAGRTNAE
ncbi:MAG: HAMP domain-containing protein [Nitrospirota bacterium]|nr:HAMP domain-containing protein [Nitrospirota bacterium]